MPTDVSEEPVAPAAHRDSDRRITWWFLACSPLLAAGLGLVEPFSLHLVARGPGAGEAYRSNAVVWLLILDTPAVLLLAGRRWEWARRLAKHL